MTASVQRAVNLLLIPALFTCRGVTPKRAANDAPRGCVTVSTLDGTCTLYSVSLVQLLVGGGAYHGRKVATAGYVRWDTLARGGPVAFLYLSGADAEAGINENAILLDASEADSVLTVRREGYVRVVGIYDDQLTSPTAAHAGQLIDIDRAQWLANRADQRTVWEAVLQAIGESGRRAWLEDRVLLPATTGSPAASSSIPRG